ncbi:MAG: type II toxin-antitoxin system RelE/ParE family toxin [Candidatus Hydrogenedentes bacterium]|nr:type II toxin-antitoxin system RelE/ParE family toxin [Candidatus Hydrogenedentota bacterium]
MDDLLFCAGSQRDFRKFPLEVQEVMLHGLFLACNGRKHQLAKPLKGFPGAREMEIPYGHAGDAYRVIYTTRFPGTVNVLHAFKKKSKRGIATPRKEMDIVRARLKALSREHRPK